MTYRIKTGVDTEVARITFEGLLDAEALGALLSTVAAARHGGAGAVRLVLGVGTTVDAGCINALRAVDGLVVEAASPFLSHWLRQAGLGHPED